jgi:hypothetical protein
MAAHRLHALFTGKNFLEKCGGLGGGRGADFYFFLSDQVEETVQSLADDIFVEIELVRDGPATGSGFDDVLILFDYAPALQRTVDDRGERAGYVGGAGLLKVFRGGGIAVAEDLAGACNDHLLESLEENLLRLRCRVLGGPVDIDFKVVYGFALAQQAHGFSEGLQLGGQQYANGFVIQESIGLAGERDRLVGAEFEGLLETGNYLLVGEAGGVPVIGGFVGLPAVFVDLGCRIRTAADRQNDSEQRKAHKIHGESEESFYQERRRMGFPPSG